MRHGENDQRVGQLKQFTLGKDSMQLNLNMLWTLLRPRLPSDSSDLGPGPLR